MYNKGYWFDGCEHPEDSYIGSFSIDNNKYDVYHYPDGKWSGDCDKGVCIRFGAWDGDYYGIINLDVLAQTVKRYPEFTVYVTAYSMILAHQKKGN